LPHLQSGKLRALAVAAPKRVEQLPNVPTFAELKMAPVNDQVWYGLLAPAKTPEDIVRRIHAAAIKVLSLPDVRQKLLAQTAVPIGNSPEEFRRQIVSERDKMIDLVKRQGIKLDQ
jgi:tripartite-type tricarboxylate transporter receptor subunit TctC